MQCVNGEHHETVVFIGCQRAGACQLRIISRVINEVAAGNDDVVPATEVGGDDAKKIVLIGDVARAGGLEACSGNGVDVVAPVGI